MKTTFKTAIKEITTHLKSFQNLANMIPFSWDAVS